MRGNLRAASAVLVVLAVMALFVGCGGGQEATSPGSVTSTGSTDGPTIGSAQVTTADPDRVIIGYKQAVGRAGETAVANLGGQVRHTYHLIPATAASLSSTAVETLRKDPRVSYIVPDARVYALAQTTPWGIARIQAPAVHTSGNTGAGVKVAIIDTGIDGTHPDLAANYAGGRDFVNLDDDPTDDHGHGTHCAGIVGALNNDTGVIGVAPQARLYALKVLDSSGSGYFSDVIAALQWCVDNGIQVASMSFGSTGDPGTPVKTACDAAYAANVLLVAAAGNSGNFLGIGNNVGWPARYDSVIAVAATNSSDKRPYFSSTGPAVELAAPGVDILSSVPGGSYEAWSGTSMACPHVSGAAALVIGSGVTGAAAIRTRLQQTATDLGRSGRDTLYGCGLINALGAGGAPPTTGTIAGRVTSAVNGLGIIGATVQTDTGQTARTTLLGRYTLTDVPIGTRQVTASATNFQPLTAAVDVTGGATTQQSFALQPIPPPMGTIAGTVTDATSGNPVAGAVVRISLTQSTRTDASGHYTLTNVKTGTRRVTVIALGFWTQSADVTVVASETTTRDFVLRRFGRSS